jgi:hypothetical protein
MRPRPFLALLTGCGIAIFARMASEIQILTDVEAAEFLRLKITQTVRLAKAGHIPRIDLPDGQIRFLLSDLVAYVDSCRVSAAVAGPEVAHA